MAYVVLGCACWSTLARAQSGEDATRSAARDMGYAGVEAFQAGDYPTAVSKLGKAYGVLRVPTLGLWFARSLAKSGRLIEAAERYLEVTRLEVKSGDVATQKQAQLDAERERAELVPRIPSLFINVQGDVEAAVSVDGQALPTQLLGEKRPTDPGKHVIVARAGSAQARQETEIREGESKKVVLVLEPGSSRAGAPSASKPAEQTRAGQGSTEEEPASSGGTRRTVAWATLGVGAVGLAVGTATGIWVLTERGALNCPDDSCTTDKRDEVDTFNTMRTVSTVGFIAGFALAGTGLTLLLTEPEQTRTGMSLVVGPLRAGLKGAF